MQFNLLESEPPSPDFLVTISLFAILFLFIFLLFSVWFLWTRSARLRRSIQRLNSINDQQAQPGKTPAGPPPDSAGWDERLKTLYTCIVAQGPASTPLARLQTMNQVADILTGPFLLSIRRTTQAGCIAIFMGCVGGIERLSQGFPNCFSDLRDAALYMIGIEVVSIILYGLLVGAALLLIASLARNRIHKMRIEMTRVILAAGAVGDGAAGGGDEGGPTGR